MPRKLTISTIPDGILSGTKIVTGSIPLSALDDVRITSVTVSNSSYIPTGGNTVSTSGGYVVIAGGGFVNGCTVVVGNTVATSVSFVSSTQIQSQLPAKVAGSYFLYVTNPNGSTSLKINGVTFS